MLFLPIAATVGGMVLVLARVSVWRVVGLCSGNRTYAGCRPFNQFIEFSPVKPNASALLTVVNFNALAFGRQKA